MWYNVDDKKGWLIIMERNTTKKHWLKGLAMAAALVMAVSTFAPTPVQAAGKMTVKVASPKKGVKLSGTKLNVYTKTSVQMNVKAPVTKTEKKIVRWRLEFGQYKWVPVYKKVEKTVNADVTAKATYKTSNRKVVSVSKKGKVTAKRSGTATLTVKYKGTVKKLRVTVSLNHKHNWKAHKKTKTVVYWRWRCHCGVINPSPEHSINHIYNGEMTNKYSEDYEEKVTYTDYYYCECGAKKAGEPEPKGDYE